jgi:hypothetical protein
VLFESLYAAGVEECPHLGDGDAVEHGEALGLWQSLPDEVWILTLLCYLGRISSGQRGGRMERVLILRRTWSF